MITKTTKKKMTSMINKLDLQFVRYCSGISHNKEDLEVYLLNETYYRIFLTNHEHSKVKYLDISKEDYSYLEFSHYNNLVRFLSCLELFKNKGDDERYE